MAEINWSQWDTMQAPEGTRLPGTEIELIRPVNARSARAVLFDFDGTLSLIRSGWMEVMIPMMVEILWEVATDETVDQLEQLVRGFVERLTGKQTIYQMIELARQVQQRGGSPLDPVTYKHQYLARLSEKITDRLEGLENGRITPREMLVPGSIELLEACQRRGLKIFLASGTDEHLVAAEADLLGIRPYLEGQKVYGAIDDYKKFSKRMVIQRIVQENHIQDFQLLGFGDGYVEIEDVKQVQGVAIGVASDEPVCQQVDPWKRKRLILAGADIIVANYLQQADLLDHLFQAAE